MGKKKSSGHAKMKPNASTAPNEVNRARVKEMQQAVVMNELALATGVKLLAEIHPNDQDLGKAVRDGIANGIDVKALAAVLDKDGDGNDTESGTESNEEENDGKLKSV